MGYYRLLNLQKEPFSTSPDPTFFYLSSEHRQALFRLCVSVQLKRGLNVILGDVGTGKTTLSRRLSQKIRDEERVLTYIVLNPVFKDEIEFLSSIAERFGIMTPLMERARSTEFYYREIEDFLFRKGVEENQTVVLMIDEAQKLSDACLEALRGLLNYETNEHKLLQVILFSQVEVVPRLKLLRNFWDRVTVKHMIHPLDYKETCELIRYRLTVAGYHGPVQLFSDGAMRAIFRATHGFPRKVTQLCHDALEYLIMHNRDYVSQDCIENIIVRESRWNTEAHQTGAQGSDASRGTRLERSHS